VKKKGKGERNGGKGKKGDGKALRSATFKAGCNPALSIYTPSFS
jgi:hypothetical protein